MQRRVAHTMGMPISLAVRGAQDDTARIDGAWAEVMAELRWVDLTFSTYRSDSWVSRIACGEARLDQAPARLREVHAIGERAAADGAGAFSCWRATLDRDRHWDPTGVVKGWAVQRAAEHHLDQLGLDYCLSAGGDMVCRTWSPDVQPWRIGVEDPGDTGQFVAVIPIHNGGIASSGAARRGAHIYDPRTAAPALGPGSVTVIAPTLCEADIAATTAYVLGDEADPWLQRRADERHWMSVIVTESGTRVIAPADAGAQAQGQTSPTASSLSSQNAFCTP